MKFTATSQRQFFHQKNTMTRIFFAYLMGSPGWCFPSLVACPRRASQNHLAPTSSDFIDLFVKLRRDLRTVSPDLLASLREHRFFTDVSSIALPGSAWAIDPGELAEIDLDNFCVGPIYSDGLMGLIRRGAPKETLAAFCQKLAPKNPDPRRVTMSLWRSPRVSHGLVRPDGQNGIQSCRNRSVAYKPD